MKYVLIRFERDQADIDKSAAVLHYGDFLSFLDCFRISTIGNLYALTNLLMSRKQQESCLEVLKGKG